MNYYYNFWECICHWKILPILHDWLPEEVYFWGALKWTHTRRLSGLWDDGEQKVTKWQQGHWNMANDGVTSYHFGGPQINELKSQMSPCWRQTKRLRRSGTNPPLRSCRASRGSSRRTRTLGSSFPPAVAPHMPREQVAWTKWSIATLWHSDKKKKGKK